MMQKGCNTDASGEGASVMGQHTGDAMVIHREGEYEGH